MRCPNATRIIGMYLGPTPIMKSQHRSIMPIGQFVIVTFPQLCCLMMQMDGTEENPSAFLRAVVPTKSGRERS